ncbi:MAG: DNA translocase FtsK [Phascolarctobacterium sp.]|nr:DNA translocase FtsK [Phascolarctobacterium sp.]
MKRLLGVLLMLISSAAIYACLNDVRHGILVFFKDTLTKYLGEYAVVAPIIFLLIGIKVFFDARINASKIEAEDASKIIVQEETPIAKPRVIKKTEAVSVKQKSQSKQKVEPKVEPKDVKLSVYDQEEFEDFTEGIRKPSTFRRILNYNSTKAYDSEQAKEEITKDPVQVPKWQEEKQNVVIRPIINYDKAPKNMPEGNFIPRENETEEAFIEEAPAAEPEIRRPIIINNYSKATQEETPAKKVPLKKEEPEITIIDSADNITPTAGSQGKLFSEDTIKKSSYRLPPLEILDKPVVTDPVSYKNDIMRQCSVLEQTLADFKVRAKVIAVTRGPSVTRFELEPAPGVKVSSVVNLADDIALKLAAPGVRIEAPIPGKAAIGIEVPNIKNDPVNFREVVDNEVVAKQESRLCIGLGKDISGNIIPADLSKMPHLLVAGSTGSGKSVCINTIIAGILYKAHPDEVKLILVDPKVVELSNYNGIPHLLVPVVTDAKKAASALHWAVAEMERRYKAFADNHVREIKSYNAQAVEKMPYIVIIIDELSDLMMVAKVDVEDAILRLAQKARAAGIHLILATQRPSVDVITGIVKANIPSRIAFAVSSQTDSRTILDMGGAEKLLGKGDMLFYPIGFNKPVRVQGAFVSDAELNRIVDFIVKQSIPVEYKEEVTSQALECDAKENAAQEEGSSSVMEDELFEDALRLVMDMGQASSSMLQRRFRIGYTRAARLVDTMEELGIVGQSVGSKPREIILSRQEIEERFLYHD